LAFLDTRERAVTSYDYIDIASGTGVQRYYGAILSGATLAGGNEYVLTDQVVRSGTGGIYLKYYNPPDTNFNSLPEVVFELPFNKPQTIKGTGVVNITTGMNGGSSGGDMEAKGAVVLMKYDGTTTTEMVSGAYYHQELSVPSNGYRSKGHGIYLDIPETKFKNGDTLKLSVQMQVKNNSGDPMWWGFAADPEGNDDLGVQGRRLIYASGSTILRADIPYRIRL